MEDKRAREIISHLRSGNPYKASLEEYRELGLWVETHRLGSIAVDDLDERFRVLNLIRDAIVLFTGPP